MDVEFADDDCYRLDSDASFDMGLPPGVVKAYRKRLTTIRAAVDERPFYAHKSWHYEKLKGNRQHQHSLRLNDQYRLILEIVVADSGRLVRIIGVEDYH
jgi:proteic killer suppression protein